jgi:hypothetical protein
VTVSDPISGRYFREFRRRCKSVGEFKKMRSAAQYLSVARLGAKHTVSPGAQLVLQDNSVDVLPDRTFRTLAQLFQAFTLMTNGWAMTATEMVPSKARPGEQTPECSLSECLSYRDFIVTKALAHPGQEGDVVLWLIDRDRQTRVAARARYLEGAYPWGEALKMARDIDVAVLWTCGNTSLVASAVPVLRSNTAMKTHEHQYKTGTKRSYQQSSASDGPDNSSQICNLYNSTKGCVKGKCPNGRRHVCNFRVPGGFCGSSNHASLTHPQRGAAQDQPRKGQGKAAKGKGKRQR